MFLETICDVVIVASSNTTTCGIALLIFLHYFSKLKLYKGASYIVNVGSVGQPRDCDPRACYVIYDTDIGIIETKRVSYDVGKAQEKVMKAGLPPYLAERLGRGW